MPWMQKVRNILTGRNDASSNRGFQNQPIDWNHADTDSEKDADEDVVPNEGSCRICHDLKLHIHSRDFNDVPYKEFEANIAALKKVAKRRQCSICALIWQIFGEFPPEGGWPPKGKSIKVRYRRPAENCFEFGVLSAQNISTTEFRGYTMRRQSLQDHEHTVEWYSSLPKAHTFIRDPDTPSGQSEQSFRRVHKYSGSRQCLQLAREWLEECRTNHPICCQTSADFAPTRLIDTQSGDSSRVYLRKMSGSPCGYATLSYCWGSGEKGIETVTRNLLDHQNEGLLVSDIPRTVQDAVKIAAELNIRYLWIDRLCIIQDDAGDWATESCKMCDIYSKAVLMISADGSDSVWDGIFRNQKYALWEYQPYGKTMFIRPKQSHQTLLEYSRGQWQPIYRRGWTLQEWMMSRRILHYTTNELVWECNTKWQCQCRRETHPAFEGLYSDMENMDRVYAEWRDVVQEYSSRSLTRQSDKLPAISGVVARFQEIMMQVTGEVDTHLAGLWKGDLAAELAWMPENQYDRHPDEDDPDKSEVSPNALATATSSSGRNDEKPDKHFIAPSWSWAATNECIHYLGTTQSVPFRSLVNITSTSTTLKDPRNPNGQVSAGSITLQGHLVRDLRLQGYRAEYTNAKGKSMRPEHWCILSDTNNNLIEVGADDPITVYSNPSQYRRVICLLIGTQTVKLERGNRIIGLAPADRRSLLSKEGIERCRSEAGRDVNDGGKDDDDLRDIFQRGAGDVIPFSCYLILASCVDGSGLYERVGCFHVGFNFTMNREGEEGEFADRDVMREIFRKREWGEVTIV